VRNGIFVGEDADDVGAPLDLAVEALEWIDGVDFRPVILREVMKAKTSASASSMSAASFGILHPADQRHGATPE